jgi:hypothetical protein
VVEVERVSHEADSFNPTCIQTLRILDWLTFCRQVGVLPTVSPAAGETIILCDAAGGQAADLSVQTSC